MAVIVHGGPQSAVTDAWNYRWNPQLFSAAGFVTLCVNFHASPGFGAKFREAVSKDWSGAAFEDIIAATENACQQLPYVDRNRVGAAGASFGGYMMNVRGTNASRFDVQLQSDFLIDLETRARIRF